MPVDVLTKSAPAIMHTVEALATRRSIPRSPVAKIALTCAVAAGRAKRGHLVVERLPVPGQYMTARNDDVDFTGAGRDRCIDFGELGLHRRLAGGETGRHGRHGNVRAGERRDRGANHRVVDADRTDLSLALGDWSAAIRVRPDRRARLGAEPLDAAGRVVARERRQIHAAHRLEQPRRLPCVLDGAAARKRLDAALDRAQIDANRIDPAAIEAYARIAGGFQGRASVRYRSNQAMMALAFAADCDGRAAMLSCDAPGTLSSAVGMRRSCSAW
jgi:hypothetical protein